MLNAAPRFDDATQYSFKWNRTLIDKIGLENIVELLEEDCTRESFEEEVSGKELFIFYDHGSEGGLVAQGGLDYIVDSGNVRKLKGAEVYTMCCSAAARIGKEAYRAGVKAWWGYTKPFSFVPDEEKVYEMLSNLGLELRLKEKCKWQTAVEKVKDAYDEEIAKAQNPWVKISLINDRDCLVCWDDENPPDTTCLFRLSAIRMFGLPGHKMTRKSGYAILLMLISYGVALHDFSHQVWQLKGTAISLEGGYLGFLGMLIGVIIYGKEYLKSL